MLILKVANIFVVLALEVSECWPSLKHIASGFYIRTGPDANKIVTNNTLEVLLGKPLSRRSEIYFTFPVYIDVLNIIYEGGGAVFETYYIHSKGIKLGTCMETSHGVLWCGSLTTYMTILAGTTILKKLDIIGYEPNYHKFVGCFEDKYIEVSDPKPNSDDCSLTCIDSPFYGYNKEEECICVLSVPKFYDDKPSCGECATKIRNFMICGDYNHTSVFSKNQIQDAQEYNLAENLECAMYNDACPNTSCASGKKGFLCELRDCTVNNGRCEEKKECLAYNEFFNENAYYDGCYCRKGYYMTENSECYDVNECVLDEVCAIYKGDCTNTDGSFTCKCGPGFTQLDERTCEDTDECIDTTSCNMRSSVCQNFFGYYDCICRRGFIKNKDLPLNISCQAVPKPQEGNFILYFFLLLLLLIIIAGGGYYYNYMRENE